MADNPPTSGKPPAYLKIESDGVYVNGDRPLIEGQNGKQALWKIHLNVSRDMNDPTTRAMYEWAVQNRDKIYQAKIGHDGKQAGKGMTVYFNSIEEMHKAVAEIEAMDKSGKIKLRPPGAAAVMDDMPMGKSGKVMGRFDAQYGTSAGTAPGQYNTAGRAGLPMPGDMGLSGKLNEAQLKQRLLFGYSRAKQDFGHAFTGTDPKVTPDWAKWLFDKNTLTPPPIATDPHPPMEPFHRGNYDFSKPPGQQQPPHHVPNAGQHAANAAPHEPHPAQQHPAPAANAPAPATQAHNAPTATPQTQRERLMAEAAEARRAQNATAQPQPQPTNRAAPPANAPAQTPRPVPPPPSDLTTHSTRPQTPVPPMASANVVDPVVPPGTRTVPAAEAPPPPPPTRAAPPANAPAQGGTYTQEVPQNPSTQNGGPDKNARGAGRNSQARGSNNGLGDGFGGGFGGEEPSTKRQPARLSPTPTTTTPTPPTVTTPVVNAPTAPSVAPTPTVTATPTANAPTPQTTARPTTTNAPAPPSTPAPPAQANAPVESKPGFKSKLAKAGGPLGTALAATQISGEAYDIINNKDMSAAQKAEAIADMGAGLVIDGYANALTFGQAGGAASTLMAGQKAMIKEGVSILLAEQKLQEDFAGGKITKDQYDKQYAVLDGRTERLKEMPAEILLEAAKATSIGVIVTGVPKIVEGIDDAVTTYAEQDKRFTASQDNRHITTVSNRIFGKSAAENEALRQQFKERGAKFDERGLFDLNDPHTREIVRGELENKKNELRETIVKKDGWLVEPGFNPFASRKRSLEFDNAKSDLAVYDAATTELNNYQQNRDAMLAKRQEAEQAKAYLAANPDVKEALESGRAQSNGWFTTAQEHYERYGKQEGRHFPTPEEAQKANAMAAAQANTIKKVVERLPTKPDGSITPESYAQKYGQKDDKGNPVFNRDAMSQLASDVNSLTYIIQENPNRKDLVQLRDGLKEMAKVESEKLNTRENVATMQAMAAPNDPNACRLIANQLNRDADSGKTTDPKVADAMREYLKKNKSNPDYLAASDALSRYDYKMHMAAIENSGLREVDIKEVITFSKNKATLTPKELEEANKQIPPELAQSENTPGIPAPMSKHPVPEQLPMPTETVAANPQAKDNLDKREADANKIIEKYENGLKNEPQLAAGPKTQPDKAPGQGLSDLALQGIGAVAKLTGMGAPSAAMLEALGKIGDLTGVKMLAPNVNVPKVDTKLASSQTPQGKTPDGTMIS